MRKISLILTMICVNCILFISCEKSDDITSPESNNSTTELRVDGKNNGHGYIDMGLSVKWAICNVGADSPEDYGNYYSWGETKPKSDYDWDTYKHCKGSYCTLAKYCVDEIDGYNKFVDFLSSLQTSDDAASQNWGGSWRMPTYMELDELVLNSTVSWTTSYKGTGIAGYIFKSKKTGYTNKSIFLPASGYRIGTYLGELGKSGQYWSSYLSFTHDITIGGNGEAIVTPDTNPDDNKYESTAAYCLYFSGFSNYVGIYSAYSRFYGLPIRAVCP